MVEQGYTIVRPDKRRKGIAQVLKLHVARYTKSKGYTALRTFNDKSKESILAINKKTGFVKSAELITFEKELHKIA